MDPKRALFKIFAIAPGSSLVWVVDFALKQSFAQENPYLEVKLRN